MRLPLDAEPKRARIEIVPMIDAIFFLLVFFMYSSLSMVKLNGLRAALPQTPGGTGGVSRPGPAKDAPHLIVDVRRTGVCAVGGAALPDPAAVAQAVRTRLAARPETLVVLRTEPRSPVQRLVSVMDALNSVRLPGGARPTVLIATDPVDAPETKVIGR